MKQTVTIPSSRLQHHLLQSIRLLIWLACASLAQPLAALAQTNAPAPLPPAAQEAVDKGIIAAKVPDYLLAIRYFEEARKLAPRAPLIYLNLGLAESKIPGRELRAIVWFGAYLSAYPHAPNAAAVKEQITVMDVKSESDLSRLIKAVQDAASHMPGSWKKSAALVSIANVQIKAGDPAGARNNLKSALKSADPIDTEPSPIIQSANVAKSRMQAWIASVQTEVGDIAGARETVNLIKDPENKNLAQANIAQVQARAGDIEGAQRTTHDINGKEPGGAAAKTWAQAAIAEAQLKAGDIAGAQKTNDSIQIALNQMKNKGFEQHGIAIAQAKAGNIAGAQKTTDSIQEDYWKKIAQASIAEAQAKVNPSAVVGPTTNAALPGALVNQWIAKNDELLNGPVFLDLAAHLKSLPSDNAQKAFDGLHDAAKKIADARQVITQMLKQQAKK